MEEGSRRIKTGAAEGGGVARIRRGRCMQWMRVEGERAKSSAVEEAAAIDFLSRINDSGNEVQPIS